MYVIRWMINMVNQIVAPYNFIPRWYQLELFKAMDNGCKRAFLRWHRRCGKDKCCLSYMAKAMVERPGVYYYVLPSYAQGRKIIWEGIDKDGFKILDHIPQELRASTQNQEMKIELMNGSVFRVIGADSDKINDLVGTNPMGMVLSEFGVSDDYLKVLDYFRPIFRENGGWYIINGTPRGKNHMFKLETKIRHNKEWFFSALQTVSPEHTTGRYTGLLSEEDIQDDRDEGMTEEMIEQEYGVSYTAVSRGKVYEEFLHRAHRDGRIGSFPPDASKWVYTFWDLGVDDSTAIWFLQIDGGRKILIDYYESSDKDIAHYVEILRNKNYKYRTHYMPWDGDIKRFSGTGILTSSRKIFEQCAESAGICAHTVGVKKSTRIIDDINAVRAQFSKLYFNEGFTSDGIEKLGLYRFRIDDKKGTTSQEPIHDWTSHCADALRLLPASDDYEDELDEITEKISVLTDYDPIAF